MVKLNTITKEIKRLDPKLKSTDETFQVAVIILASALNSLKTPKPIGEFTGYPLPLIRQVLSRLKQNGLGWKEDGRFYQSGWDDKKNGGFAFWLDVGIAQGYLRVKRG